MPCLLALESPLNKIYTQRKNDRRTIMYAPAARIPRVLLPTRCSWRCSGVVQQKRVYSHRQPSPSPSSFWKHGTWSTPTSLHSNPAVAIAGHRVPFRQRRFVGDQRFCTRLHHSCVHKRGTLASASNELNPAKCVLLESGVQTIARCHRQQTAPTPFQKARCWIPPALAVGRRLAVPLAQ